MSAISYRTSSQSSDYKILFSTIGHSRRNCQRSSFILKMIVSYKEEKLPSWWKRIRHFNQRCGKRTERSAILRLSKIFKSSRFNLLSDHLRGNFVRNRSKSSSWRRNLQRREKKMIAHKTNKTFKFSKLGRDRLKFSRKTSRNSTIFRIF